MQLERLLDAAEHGATVVTANARTQRRVMRHYDARQQALGREAWPTPQIFHWGAWIEFLWQELVLLPSRQSPLHLNAAQQEVIWEQAIRNSSAGRELLAVTAAAKLARDAWRLLHEYRVCDRSLLDLTADGAAFRSWAEAYSQQCAANQWTDEARVPDLLSDAIAARELKVAEEVLFAGFDRFTAQQERLRAALRAAGCREHHAGELDEAAEAERLCRVPLNDTAAEVRYAAEWARTRLLASPDSSIGIVVPQLESLRERVERIFAEVLAPQSLVNGGDARRVFELSLGRPLAGYPMVYAAVQTLRWLAAPLDISTVGVLLRGPYLKGAEAEAERRAMLDVKLRSRCGLEVSVGEVRRFAGALREDGAPRSYNCPVLAATLARLAKQFDPAPKPASAWSRHFDALLSSAGWPGDRPLNSTEHQTCEAWFKLLQALATLDTTGATFSCEEALARLRQLAAERTFQPENLGAPVQIMGALEASGSHFDYLWVLGLDDENWPGHPAPNPLLPLMLQRRYGIPHASPAEDLAFAERATARLRRSAGEVIFSFPKVEGDRVLRPSPLICDIGERDIQEVLPQSPATWVGNISAAAGPLAPIVEATPALLPDDVHGGAKIFQLQAACPFRAFVQLRLNAESIAEPVAGLDPMERGRLVHLALQLVWQHLDGSADLRRYGAGELREIVARCAEEAVKAQRVSAGDTWSVRFANLECQRLTDLLCDWLAVEKDRTAFKVLLREQAQEIELGGVRAVLRVDRVDELEGGGKVIIDYKTGPPVNLDEAWDAARPDAPQLPLYAVFGGNDLRGLAFAHLRPGDLLFKGQADAGDILPGVPALEETTLREKVGQWRLVLEALAEQFRSGEISVDPKNPPETCKHCAYPPLCRIHDNSPGARAEEDADEK